MVTIELIRCFKAKGKDYSRDIAAKMFNQDNVNDRIDEKVLLSVLKQIQKEIL